MLTKRMLNLSVNFRKLTFASKLIPVVSVCQVKGFKDRVKALSNVDYESPKFQYKLYDSTNSSIVLDLLKFNFNDPNLNSSDTIIALTKLVQLCKQEALPPGKVVYEDFFNNLCVSINSQANNFTLSDVLQIIDLLCELNVDSSSESIKHLLDRVHALLNTASFADCNRIMQIITKVPSHSTTQAIKTRLVKKFIRKISTEFDQNDFDFLVEAFRFACHYIHDEKITRIIIDALININIESQAPASIISLMEALNSSHFSTEWSEILLKAQNAFIKNISKIENKDIANTLKKSSLKVNENRLEEFYNKTLFDKAIQKLISTECNLRDGTQLLDALITVRHTSKELLNYLSGQIYVEKEIDGKFINDEIVFKMLEGFADLKYKPLCWEMFLSIFKRDDMLNYRRQRLIYRAYHLACLGCYELKILEKIFESDFDFGSKRFMHHNYLRLYQILKTMPDYNGPLPSQMQIRMFETLMRENIGYPFYTSLTEALGGSEYVKTNVRTKLFHTIDHVIAFKPGGEALAINNIKKEENIGKNSTKSIEYLEDLNIPKNCEVIAVMSVPSAWYARNTNQILGKFATYFETLESLSCRVITICGKEWQSLPKTSRTTFLSNLIRKKLENKER